MYIFILLWGGGVARGQRSGKDCDSGGRSCDVVVGFVVW